jgi:hypothetical protein
MEGGTAGFTSVLINDLNLELNEYGKVVSIWGLCPHTTWRNARLHPCDPEFRDIFFLPDAPLKRGVSTRLSHERWPVFFDSSSGWVQLMTETQSAMSVRMHAQVIFDFDEQDCLCGIWLRPTIV